MPRKNKNSQAVAAVDADSEVVQSPVKTTVAKKPKLDDAEAAERRKKRHIRLSAWVQASRKHGFLQKGQKFNTIPKKGSAEHAAIKEDYSKLVDEWLAAGDVPEEFRPAPVTTTTTGDVNIVVVQAPKRKRRTKKGTSSSKDEPAKKRAKKATIASSAPAEEKKQKKQAKKSKKIATAKPPAISTSTPTSPAAIAEPPTPKASSTPRLFSASISSPAAGAPKSPNAAVTTPRLASPAKPISPKTGSPAAKSSQ
jgi:hypothetical protein